MQLRARVCNAAAAAVEVRSAVDAAAAMQTMLSGWQNCITVDPQAGCVSHLQDDKCIIFSFGGGPRVQFVQVEGLPPSFIDVQHAAPAPTLDCSGLHDPNRALAVVQHAATQYAGECEGAFAWCCGCSCANCLLRSGCSMRDRRCRVPQ